MGYRHIASKLKELVAPNNKKEQNAQNFHFGGIYFS